MWRKVGMVLAAALAVWVIGSMVLGVGSSGVELGPYPPPQPGDQPLESPSCVMAHTYQQRSWPGLQTLRSDVWVAACKEVLGQQRLAAGPTCSATSFLGPGTATCTAAPDGDRLKVVVHISYPLGLDWIAGWPSTTAWTVSPGGGWFAANP
jgi:hypothetical protein